MTRLRKILRNVSWKYALGEVFLIFIGITAAIWFNNWNEEAKAKKIEIESLREIKKAIAQDLIDIEDNISGYEIRVDLYTRLEEHISERSGITDSLTSLFPYMQGYTYFLSNTGAYETLKSRGLETITEPEVRNRIVLYYDFEHQRILANEEQHLQHYFDYIKPVILKNFDLKHYGMDPVNFDQLITDNEFRQVVYWALRTDNYILGMYRQLRDTARDLETLLSLEIEKLNHG